MSTRKRPPKIPATGRLMPPKGGVTVRMYRIGHGDCFLLAFDGDQADKPVYVLIDCGYKPGSPEYIQTTIKEITQNIKEATGGCLDVAVITHEHQDHVNGITEGNFKEIQIRETWLAWTENPEDQIANQLRLVFRDKLRSLVAARHRLAAAGDGKQVAKIDEFLAFELGGEEETFVTPTVEMLDAAGGALEGSMNKRSMKVFKDRAKKVKYIRPHEKILEIQGTNSLRIFALGPPRDPKLLQDLDPEGTEEFNSFALAGASAGNYFGAAAANRSRAPFDTRFSVPMEEAFEHWKYGNFFLRGYGMEATPKSVAAGAPPERVPREAPSDAPWRRIDQEWLYSSEQLALDMNNQTNNSSLVLAFELGRGGKVLLFAADAQRGNWISWSKKEWQDGSKVTTTRDLLARTVLYKVGHHGSHNATLNGAAESEHANLGWMATGDYAQEFTAMITAVRKWAETKKGWDHPLKAIKDALLQKASGRVFQTDQDVEKMKMSENGSKVDWLAFQERTHGDRLFFDYTIHR